jgi:TfoX/Sxy family transcriptional regulator of competence genes
MAWTKSPQSLIDLFDKSVPSDPSVSRRKMFGYPAAFANDSLFIGLHQDDFIMRLSEPDRVRFSAQYGDRIFEPMKGRPMREYVRLPEELLTNARKRNSWIKRSLDYAQGIKPKQSKSGESRLKENKLKSPRKKLSPQPTVRSRP